MLRSVRHGANPKLFAFATTLGLVAMAPGLFAAEPEKKPDAAKKPAEAKKPDETKKEDAPAEESKDAKPGRKVLVLPYQAVFRSVPQSKLDNATELLHKELQNRDGLAIIRGAVEAPSSNEARPTLAKAAELMKEADAAEEGRRFDAAIDAWTKALGELEKNLPALDKIDDYLIALHRLALAELTAGDDQKAQATMEQAARMAPGLALPAEQFSRLYRARFRKIAETVVKDRPGEISVTSQLPGTRVVFDGRELEVAPVLLQRVVPGKHIVRGVIGEVQPFAQLVTVEAGKKVEINASFGNTLGGSGVGRVTDALAQNQVSAEAVQSAATAGKEAGAEFVLLGAMAKDEDRFQVHTYVVDVASTKIAEVDVAAFDLEMLTAESDVLRIVQAANAAIDNFPAGQKSLAKVENKIKIQSTVNRVSAAPELTAQATTAGEAQAGGKKGKGDRRVFVPLSGGTIQIKDEEGD